MTLIELIIVLLIIGVAVGVSTVFYANGLPSARLGAAGRELSGAIRQARLMARTHGETVTVTINPETRKYAITGRSAKTLPQGITIRAIDETTGETAAGEVEIVFHDSGTIEGKTIVLTAGRKQLLVKVDPIVGSVVLKGS